MTQKPSRSQPIRASGLLLLHRDDSGDDFLLLRHVDRWDLPKGHCEPGETFLQTALRETEEETGIVADAIDIDSGFQFELSYQVCYAEDPKKIFDKQVRYFLGYLDHKPELRLTEHQSFRWFAWEPPHQIQTQTIDPLLCAVEQYRC